MVASKYLYDEGEDEEVFNDDWAKAGKKLSFLFQWQHNEDDRIPDNYINLQLLYYKHYKDVCT